MSPFRNIGNHPIQERVATSDGAPDGLAGFLDFFSALHDTGIILEEEDAFHFGESSVFVECGLHRSVQFHQLLISNQPQFQWIGVDHHFRFKRLEVAVVTFQHAEGLWFELLTQKNSNSFLE